MKTRQGFVSNSSSSSFLVVFPHKPESVEELQKILFGDAKTYSGDYSDHNWDTEIIAKIVWNNLEAQDPCSLDAITEAVASGWVEGAPDWSCPDTRDKKEFQRLITELEESNKKFAKAHAKQFVDLNPGVVFSFVYSDDDGDMFSDMEHGPLFDRLPHLQVSHH